MHATFHLAAIYAMMQLARASSVLWCIGICILLHGVCSQTSAPPYDPSSATSWGPHGASQGDAGSIIRNETSIPPVPLAALRMYNPMTTTLLYDDPTCSLVVAYTAVPTAMCDAAKMPMDPKAADDGGYKSTDFARVFSYPLCADPSEWRDPARNITQKAPVPRVCVFVCVCVCVSCLAPLR